MMPFNGKVYLASPFFNETESTCVEKAEKILRSRGFDVFSPREHDCVDEEPGSKAWAEKIFSGDVEGIASCSRMVVLSHGGYGDTGAAWECGFAFAKGIPAVVVHLGEDENLMLTEGSVAVLSMEDLETYGFETMERRAYSGRLF